MLLRPAANISFRHKFNDLHKAIVVRNSESEEEQPIFRGFPDLRESSSGDLFSPHAANAELWQYPGRSDDLQVFRSGEKYNPVALEQRL